MRPTDRPPRAKSGGKVPQASRSLRLLTRPAGPASGWPDALAGRQGIRRLGRRHRLRRHRPSPPAGTSPEAGHWMTTRSRSRAAVSNLLRLMELADEVKQLLEQRSIEMGHARALLSLTSRRQQIEVAGLVAKKALSVRDTEALVRRLIHPAAGGSQPSPTPDPDIHRLELDLADKLGARVMFQHTSSGKGKLVVTYNSLDELEGILAHIT